MEDTKVLRNKTELRIMQKEREGDRKRGGKRRERERGREMGERGGEKGEREMVEHKIKVLN